MAAFHKDSLTYIAADGEMRARPDWSMLRFGPVALFRKPEVLAETLTWLSDNGYTIAQADCERCSSQAEVLCVIAEALGLPFAPAPNLDGSEDWCDDLQVPAASGFALVLHRFDSVAAKFRDFAWTILDILGRVSWDQLLFGRRFLCLVRSEDPSIHFGRVGGHDPWWNECEWFKADRA
jgi:hypothetical protein